MSDRGKQNDAACPARKGAYSPTHASCNEQQDSCFEIRHSALDLMCNCSQRRSIRHANLAIQPSSSEECTPELRAIFIYLRTRVQRDII